MDFTADNLDKAVSLFYRSEADQQAGAHHWLTEAQNSPQAWGFVWELLSPHRSSEVQFFAATTLHTKIMKYWHEVPSDHYEDLKKRLLEAIVTYAMGPKLVLNRLCIALSAYVIHTVPTHWPNAFEELVTSFQPQNLPNVEPERVVWILLEILTVIPEEFQSASMGTSIRVRAESVFQSVSKDILRVSEMCLMPLPNVGYNMGNLTTYINSARCAGSWLNLGGLNIQDCNEFFSTLVDLICFVYWNKTDTNETDFIEVAVEALTRLIQHPQSLKYENHIIRQTSNMLYKFERILEVERNSSDPNMDIVSALYGLLIITADNHSKLFVNNLKKENSEECKLSNNLFISILKCSGYPGVYPIDECASPLAFPFWYTLQEDILNLRTAECAQLLLVVKPCYRELVCVMLKKSMLPLSEDSPFSLDDREVFRCYRQDIADAFVHCYNVLNLEMLDILYTKLSEALRKQTGSDPNQPVRWNEVETCLHAFAAIAECIEMEELYLPKLMALIKEIPYDQLHIKVMASALETIGAYSEWITGHPQVLSDVFPLIITALGNVDVIMSATMALKDISQNYQIVGNYILPYADQTLVTIQNIIDSGLLKLSDHRRLMFSVGRVLSLMSVEKIMDYLNVILSPSFKEMQDLSNSEPSPGVVNSISSRLKIISALLSTLHVRYLPQGSEQPVLIVMRNTMPLFKTIGERFCTHHELMEDYCVVLKYVITNLMDDSKPLISDILHILVNVYRKYPQASVLTVTKTIIIMYGRDDKLQEMNHQLLWSTIEITLQMCSEYNETNNLSEKADVLEGFFGTIAQVSKKTPHLLYSSGLDLSPLFQCAILCLGMPEVQTLRNCSSFLVSFITQSRETAQVSVIQLYGESLVLRILLTLGTTAPRSCIEVFSDILFALNKKYCDNLSRWLNALLAQSDFPSPKITVEQKQQFIKTVLKEKANKRRLYEYVVEFSLTCRGIIKYENIF